MDFKKKVIGLTIGIRYNKSFRIPDIAGEIMDSLLYSKESPFDPDIFPAIQENSRRERTLYNPETSEYFRLNTDDLILGINIDNNFDSKISWLKDTVLKYLEDTLFPKYGIKNIKRLGIIFDQKTSRQPEINTYITTLTTNKVVDAENINLSFSKKLPTIEGQVSKGIQNYRNAIYTFAEQGDSLLARLDYQYYFDPIVEDLRECKAGAFMDEATMFLEKNYYSWLKKDEEKLQ